MGYVGMSDGVDSPDTVLLFVYGNDKYFAFTLRQPSTGIMKTHHSEINRDGIIYAAWAGLSAMRKPVPVHIYSPVDISDYLSEHTNVPNRITLTVVNENHQPPEFAELRYRCRE